MKKKVKIGILGGSFDPAHKGHLAISKEAKRRFDLKKIIWAITKKNPFKDESKTNLSKRIKDCKKIIRLNPFIKVKFSLYKARRDTLVGSFFAWIFSLVPHPRSMMWFHASIKWMNGRGVVLPRIYQG